MKYNEQELTLKFGVKALRGIEKELGKLVSEIGTTTKNEKGEVVSTMISIDEAIVILKHGLNNEYSEEQCEEIMEVNDGCFFTVAKEFYNSINKVYSIAESGNLQAPQS